MLIVIQDAAIIAFTVMLEKWPSDLIEKQMKLGI